MLRALAVKISFFGTVPNGIAEFKESSSVRKASKNWNLDLFYSLHQELITYFWKMRN